MKLCVNLSDCYDWRQNNKPVTFFFQFKHLQKCRDVNHLYAYV